MKGHLTFAIPHFEGQLGSWVREESNVASGERERKKEEERERESSMKEEASQGKLDHPFLPSFLPSFLARIL